MRSFLILRHWEGCSLRGFRVCSEWEKVYFESVQLRFEIVVDNDRAIIGTREKHPDIDQKPESVETGNVVEDAPEEIVG
jgi:hypothetical protein